MYDLSVPFKKKKSNDHNFPKLWSGPFMSFLIAIFAILIYIKKYIYIIYIYIYISCIIALLLFNCKKQYYII